VVLRGEGIAMTVDADATQSLRAELKSKRGALPMIDRGPGYAELRGGNAG
jgi:hypothetical protein